MVTHQANQPTNLPSFPTCQPPKLTTLPPYRYSEFVAFPIELWSEKTTYETVRARARARARVRARARAG